MLEHYHNGTMDNHEHLKKRKGSNGGTSSSDCCLVCLSMDIVRIAQAIWKTAKENAMLEDYDETL